MPYPIECLLKVNEDVGYVLLVLTVFLTQHTEIEYLFCCASTIAKSRLFLGNDLLCLWLRGDTYSPFPISPFQMGEFPEISRAFISCCFALSEVSFRPLCIFQFFVFHNFWGGGVENFMQYLSTETWIMSISLLFWLFSTEFGTCILSLSLTGL